MADKTARQSWTGSLPFAPPLGPMLAKGTAQIPEGDGWLFEPKWDGFRVLVFRDGDEVHLQSRDSRPLLRYFPELAEPLRHALPERCVVDGELVIATPSGLDFDTLQMRLHPAASRVNKLAEETPAALVAFDLLAIGDEDLRDVPFGERRQRLEIALGERPHPSVHLTPATAERDVALDWFERFEGAGFDGVMAKPLDGTYQPNKRAMVKVKHVRTVDCVLAGFRWHKSGEGVGSLVLGLFKSDGALAQLGVAASFSAVLRKELVDELEPLRANALDDHPWAEWAQSPQAHRQAGMKSRWSQGKDLSWEPVRIERVAEVRYNHLAGGRFRHPVKFVRWRHDKQPADCRFDQLDTAPPMELAEIFGS